MARRKQTIVAEILDLLDDLRLLIRRDGGDLSFENYDKGIVTIKLLGNCNGCNLVDMTYKSGVEVILKSEIPEVKSVILVQDESNQNNNLNITKSPLFNK
ncbi:NifU family protein [Mycoplasma bradburyae]|uniref:NifU family protein n=1 Tax=Mycoplasma bradburyae TaxID=2963128 RepID=UPI00233F893F|nr:NifU family protein [Mycoplasma bradburyae]MDC4184433.1 NifU family protein [Mycoplasma bradburyae]